MRAAQLLRGVAACRTATNILFTLCCAVLGLTVKSSCPFRMKEPAEISCRLVPRPRQANTTSYDWPSCHHAAMVMMVMMLLTMMMMAMMQVVTRNMKLAEGVDFAALARSTPGYVGADLAAVAKVGW